MYIMIVIPINDYDKMWFILNIRANIVQIKHQNLLQYLIP